MRIKVILGCFALAAALFLATTSRAEVRVRTDARGNYAVMQVVAGGPRWSPRVWSLTARSDGRNALNPLGDTNGDLWPAVAESNLEPRYPLVVWSRRNGTDYDLAWSRWADGVGWAPTLWVAPAGNAGDDLDADLGFDTGGLPHMVWWRNEGGRGRIYVSVMLAQGWLAPYPVTDGSVDSRYPSLELGDGWVRVGFETPDGTVSQLVEFEVPVTITEDINPLECYRLDGEPILLGSAP